VVTVKEASIAPRAEGLKVKLILHSAPAARLVLQVLDLAISKSFLLVPPVAISILVRLAVPLFFSVTVFSALASLTP
jgi:hypothetical protein